MCEVYFSMASGRKFQKGVSALFFTLNKKLDSLQSFSVPLVASHVQATQNYNHMTLINCSNTGRQ